MAFLELDQRRPGAGDQQKPARDASIGSQLDGAIPLKEVGMSSDPREAIALLRYRIVAAASDPRLTPAERGPASTRASCPGFRPPRRQPLYVLTRHSRP